MQIKNVMTRGVETIHPNATLQDAAEKMRALDIGVLPVLDQDHDQLVGMITDRDIAVRAVAFGLDPTKTSVRDCMSNEVVACFENQDIRDAAELMEEKQIRRLPVLSRERKLVGMLSLGDLAVDTGKTELAGEVLTEVSEPAHPRRFTPAR